MHGTDNLGMYLGDINGHAGRHIDEVDGIHGWCGVCPRNLKGEMLLRIMFQLHGIRERKRVR